MPLRCSGTGNVHLKAPISFNRLWLAGISFLTFFTSPFTAKVKNAIACPIDLESWKTSLLHRWSTDRLLIFGTLKGDYFGFRIPNRLRCNSSVSSHISTQPESSTRVASRILFRRLSLSRRNSPAYPLFSPRSPSLVSKGCSFVQQEVGSTDAGDLLETCSSIHCQALEMHFYHQFSGFPLAWLFWTSGRRLFRPRSSLLSRPERSGLRFEKK